MISNEERFSKFIRVPKIVILYEEGLYGILQYSQKDLAIEFKKWLRRYVLPRVREEVDFNEVYYSEENNLTNENNLVSEREFYSLECVKIAINACEIFSKVLDEADIAAKQKIKVFKALFEKSNINIPIDIEENDDDLS